MSDMRAITVAAVLMLIPVCWTTQAHPQDVLPVQPVTMSMPGGHILLQATNRSRVPATAIVAVGTLNVNGKTFQSVRFFDSTLDQIAAKPLEQGQSHSFSFFGPNPPPEKIKSRSVVIGAEILADGTTWGQPEWIEVLLLRRRYAYQFEDEALHLITDAKSSGIDVQALLQVLDSAKRRRMTEAKHPAIKQIADTTFTEVELLVGNAASKSTRTIYLPGISKYRLDVSLPDPASTRLESRIAKLAASKPSISN